jgi:hypothetical protein
LKPPKKYPMLTQDLSLNERRPTRTSHPSRMDGWNYHAVDPHRSIKDQTTPSHVETTSYQFIIRQLHQL